MYRIVVNDNSVGIRQDDPKILSLINDVVFICLCLLLNLATLNYFIVQLAINTGAKSIYAMLGFTVVNGFIMAAGYRGVMTRHKELMGIFTVGSFFTGVNFIFEIGKCFPSFDLSRFEAIDDPT